MQGQLLGIKILNSLRMLCTCANSQLSRLQANHMEIPTDEIYLFQKCSSGSRPGIALLYLCGGSEARTHQPGRSDHWSLLLSKCKMDYVLCQLPLVKDRQILSDFISDFN